VSPRAAAAAPEKEKTFIEIRLIDDQGCA